MALRLTIKGGTRVLDGRPRPPEFFQGEDEEAVMDAWNAHGAWECFDEVQFRKMVADLAGVQLPAGDDELLEAAVANSDGNMELTVIDSVASRIGAAIPR